MTGAPISNFLICSKASLSLVSHFLDLPVHVRSHKGLDIVENPGREFGTELGISREASYFRLILGFGEICSPSPVSTSPMYSKLLAPMTHFSQLWSSHALQTYVLLCQGFIMFLMVTASYSHTVMQVVSAGAILQYLPFSG